ncbi:MAG: hypothetical protein ACLP5H_16920 [Desulfomonilaceae bacterium]
MSVTLYRIKLYGHSGSDTQLFCKSLATVLNIDEERARTLLRDTPAIIKEGIEKEKAEAFCNLLAPIRALCIVEPLDGKISEDGPSPATVSTPLLASPEADDLKKRASLRSWIWMVALVAAIGIFLLFIGGGFISSFWSVYHQNRLPATSPEPTESQSERSSTQARPASVEELQAQTDELEARIESNRFILAQAQEARDRLYRSAHFQSKDLEELALIIRDLRDRIRSDMAQLQILRWKLQQIESTSE